MTSTMWILSGRGLGSGRAWAVVGMIAVVILGGAATDRGLAAEAGELIADASGGYAPQRPGRGEVDHELLAETAKALGELPPAEPDAYERFMQWGGLRPTLADAGFTFEGSWIVDYSKPILGGINPDTDAFRHLLDLRFDFDTKPLLNLEGGEFSIDLQNQSGRNGTDLVVGDAQGFDNADADGRTQIAELWYQQTLLDGKLRVKVGKVDANSEFAVPEYAGEFLNSSYGFSPTVTGLPTYPDGAFSVNVFVYPTDWFYAGAGVYDGSGADGILTGSLGPGKIIHGESHVFTIGEVGLRWSLASHSLPGRFAVGGAYHNGVFDRFDGTRQSGVGSFYALLEQKVWHRRFDDPGSDDGVYVTLQYGRGDEGVSDFADHVGAGVVWVGPYEKRDPDSLGFGVSWVRFSDAAGAGFTENSETAFEAFYNYQVTSYLNVKPDFQYIVHPGGDASVDNALVFTLRVTLGF